MSRIELERLLPQASQTLIDMLDGARGAVQSPIRSEIFGLQRFAQHGRSLAQTHRVGKARVLASTFFPRLKSNIHTLREARQTIAEHASYGYDISPAAEWLLDNFHLIEAQLKEIHDGLPRSYFRALPMLLDEPLAGLPRVYGVAWAFVAHTDGAFDEQLLTQFLSAYQETRELNLAELWALPTTLRVLLVENLRRLAEQVACNKAAREVANQCCDRFDTYDVDALGELLALLNKRGVGRVFLAQMALRLQDRPASGDARVAWLLSALPDLAALINQQSADQAADNLSVSNAITALRAVGDADWPSIVAHSSLLMQAMLGSAAFASEDAATQSQTLHSIELLAKSSQRAEGAVAHAVLELMQSASGVSSPAGVASYWLRGVGRAALAQRLGLSTRAVYFAAFSWRASLARFSLSVYLGSLLLGTVCVVASVLLRDSAPWVIAQQTPLLAALTVIAAVLMLFPASEAVVAVINRLICESARPRHLPRLALADGIPAEHRVLVVIPAMLSSQSAIKQLVHQLQLHYLANPEPHAQFALLTDWADASTQSAPHDAALLRAATEQINALNALYPTSNSPEHAPRFIVLHRERQFSETEQCWIGWERKRGKLELLIAALAQGSLTAFLNLGEISRVAPNTPYVLTLDSDTQLPPGRLRELVGVAAHPHNLPQVDGALRTVTSGYAIVQPRIVTPLPAPQEFTPYHWLFAGQCGIDPYSAASSEVYQDLFCEGTYTGKGLLNVRAVHAVLAGRLPEGQVLSHDLLEGSLARCAAVSNISVIEDAPFHADVAASRVHRWTRGDWQLLPFLLPFLPNSARYRISAINRWKLFDNLRRSLVAPASLLLVLLALSGIGASPQAALSVVLAAFLAGPLMGAVAGFSPGRDDLAKRYFYRQAAVDLLRAVCAALWQFAQLLEQALLASDAIIRALYRMTISRRHLLQWTTAAAAQAAAKTGFVALLRQHWKTPLLAVLLIGLVSIHTAHLALTMTLCLMWAASPVWIWWVSKPRPPKKAAQLTADETQLLHTTARDSWRLFERCVTASEHYLPPDNLQVSPHDALAHRTSPTNIGLYLLSAACARQFGWIGTHELQERLEQTLDTLDAMERHRGHFLNWYDTQTLAPLLPMYVSTVDSGNLSGHLLATAQACLALQAAPYDQSASLRAIRAAQQRLVPLAQRLLVPTAALAQLLDLAVAQPLQAMQRKAEQFDQLLRSAAQELAALELPDTTELKEPTEPAEAHTAALAPMTEREQLASCASDFLATLRSAFLDAQAMAVPNAQALCARRLLSLARRCEQLAWQAEFGFLYHRRRQLLHIGYRVAEQQLDASCYDLLASESRLTSLLAISKGDVPLRHWASLGRPFYAVGANAGLRSWSGSMFEYLMPTLVLDERRGSALHGACLAALKEQMAFAKQQHLPWGISESAYAGRDHTLAYQYAPQGVPRLALRRTPPDERVVAPYATALAAQLAPRAACLNFSVLQGLSARARYGFIEALDFTAARQTSGEPYTPVATFMAHHQGMSIVALANVLLSGVAQHWGMSSPGIEAMASLLQERPPREVALLYAAMTDLELQAPQSRAPSLLREVVPGMNAVEPTHVLSNGRYRVTLRPNGAGWSRIGDTGITRWRDDALRDAYGSFFYLRSSLQPQLVSLTQHPAPDPAAHYQSTFHGDRVCFDATWQEEVQSHITVWVSAEDDIEFRQVELRNLSDNVQTFELISAFEVTLAEARADEAHPAFSNLFVSAEWQVDNHALLFSRKPRLGTEQTLHAAHFLTEAPPQVMGVRQLTDRQHWLGRNRNAASVLADFAAAGLSDQVEANGQSTGLDPVCVLAVQLRIAPHGKARVTFATTASNNAGTVRAVLDKYRQRSHVKRASLMSATLSGIRLRAASVGPDTLAAIQSLTTALVFNITRPSLLVGGPADAPCDRRLLWRLSLSGDRPIILLSLGNSDGTLLLRSLTHALRQWSWGGIACDLVVINTEPASYLMPLHREISQLQERHVSDSAAQSGADSTGFYLLHADKLTPGEFSTLQTLARVHFKADGRPLSHHVKEWCDMHERAFEARSNTSVAPALASTVGRVAPVATSGDFASDVGEYRFNVSAQLRPARPWLNVMANPSFGTQLTEAGGGYTWARNSRLMQLTEWSNDPVADPAGEFFALQDLKTRAVWSVAASQRGAAQLSFRVSHGQGYSVISHRRGDLDVSVSWCVDSQLAVKQVRIRIINRGHQSARLRVIGLVEWLMGSARADRATIHTALAQTPQPAEKQLPAKRITALLATQREQAAGFGGGTAFLAVATNARDQASSSVDWTCDRRECFDARGNWVLPDHFEQTSGGGLDPCAALSCSVGLLAGETVECVFLIGYADSAQAAEQLMATALAQPALTRIEQVRSAWDQLLGATTVSTPDPLFDVMVNRWLLYQTVSCRLWAKAAFYQAGGATGFRDQLQDAMALAWAAPQMLREQIVLAASRQFAAGDVQHWWHAPTGAGVRTHFSDDLLWLAYACVHYLRRTGDNALLDQQVPFIEGAAIAEGAEDAYYVPVVSADTASVYEHAARAIDRSLALGAHGLPLMGSGDWNDGMNRVGHEGRGESVWLGWFLCQLVDDFAPLALERGEQTRAQHWQKARQGWLLALANPAWDGHWFKRAFFDDGQALGSSANAQASIDLIAQAWAVLSSATTQARQAMAMAAVEARLVDPVAGLIKLLAPPLVDANPSAGYIQAYPPGVRENGGQYSHAGVWALMAQAQLHGQAQTQSQSQADAKADLVYRYFTYLNPAHRSANAERGAVYGIEPYVIAGDVYSQPPYTGRGGWSWYTGAAAWLQRAAIESMFGLQQTAQSLSFTPCLPSHWQKAELTLRRDGKAMRFILYRATPERALAATAVWDAQLLLPKQQLVWPDLPDGSCFVVPLLPSAA